MITVFVDLYQQKLNLFEQLEKLSATMAEFSPGSLATDDGEAEKFVNLLDQRTALIGQIDLLTDRIVALGSEEGQTLDLNSLKQAIQTKISAIQTQNTTIETTVQGSLDQIREQAKKLQEGIQSNRAYVPRVPTAEGAFIDKRR